MSRRERWEQRRLAAFERHRAEILRWWRSKGLVSDKLTKAQEQLLRLAAWKAVVAEEERGR